MNFKWQLIILLTLSCISIQFPAAGFCLFWMAPCPEISDPCNPGTKRLKNPCLTEQRNYLIYDFDKIIIKSNTLYPFISDRNIVRISDLPIIVKLCLPDQCASKYKVTLRNEKGTIWDEEFTNRPEIKLPIDLVDKKYKILPGQKYSLTIAPINFSNIDKDVKSSTISFSVLSENDDKSLTKELQEIDDYKNNVDKDINSDTKSIAKTNVYRKYGLFFDSIKNLERLTREKTSSKYDVYIYKYLADSYLEMGLFSEAKKYYEKALNELPNMQNTSEEEMKIIKAVINETLGYASLHSIKDNDRLSSSINSFKESEKIYCSPSPSSYNCNRLKEIIKKLENLQLTKK